MALAVVGENTAFLDKLNRPILVTRAEPGRNRFKARGRARTHSAAQMRRKARNKGARRSAARR